MQQLPEQLRPLAGYRQFILWKIAQRDSKTVKLPVDWRTAGVGDAHNPELWLDADTAINTAAAYGQGYGVGFVFTPNDPFFFVDIDKCLNADNATWSPVAMDLMTRLNGAAVEVSQSGRGLHIIGQGQAPDHSCKNIALGVEMYTEGRFVALTGERMVGNAAVDCTAALAPLVDAYFPAKAATKGQEWTEEAVEGSTPPETDEELIERALKSGGASAVFGNKTTFAALWEGDEDELAKAYADENRAYDASSADAALAQHLAFWTGNNCERIKSLMWQSGLVRDKWQREDYLIRTITRAASLQETFYTGGKRQADEDRVKIEAAGDPLGNVANGTPELLAGYQFLGATQQIEHFKGCVYVQSLHRVLTPRGLFLKQDQFNATYGGYHFQIDDTGKATKKAWEAFTESQVIRYPKAEFGCFRPEIPPGALIQEEGYIFVNTYVPIETPRQQGDPAPFLRHLAALLPNQSDRDILLAYMAACVQHKGVKFQWAPLLQGTEGNGKTLFTRCVAFAVGDRYTHLPPASEISEKFNEWLFGKVFIGIEDVYVPDHKKEVIEVLKPMITNDRLAMRAMQQAQVMGDNRANFMLNSNHKDAIRKTRTDRRFAVFYTAQQSAEDLARDGMNGNYFPDLYAWLRNGGYAIVADYLATYAIPDELNPATKCHRAPETTSTNEAIAASMGGVEQEIIEAIEEGRPGFAGGWISSVAVERLLNDARMTRAIPHNKRRDLLKSLGYDWHPSLNNGRVNNPIPLDDNKKPRLFIKDGHIARNVTAPAEVARMYQEAQGAPAAATGKAVEVFKQ